MRRKIKREIRFCKCGCGYSKEIKITSTWKYHRGHFKHKSDCQCYTCKSKRRENVGSKHPRWVIREVRFCACGCGGKKKVYITSTWRFIHGHHMKIESYKYRPEVWKKIGKALTGGKHSDETKRKIAISRKGKPGKPKSQREIRRCKQDGCCGIFKVRINSPKIYCSISCSSKRMSGKNNPNWQGGISKVGYPFNFNEKLRELIRERDGYACQLCGITQSENDRKLSIHHIDYIKENLNPKNLISLCTGCNARVNYGRKKWKRFLQQRLKLRIVG